MSEAQDTPSYEIQGRRVTMPVIVRDASGGVASFVVPSRVANELVGDAFDVAEFLPGRTLLFLGCIDYKDNDLGDYNEVALNFFVRRRGESAGIPYLGSWLGVAKSTLPTFCWKMPVNQSFTRDAGDTIWGFPKTVEKIDFDYATPGRFGARLEMDGREVFTLEIPRGGDGTQPETEMTAYTYINGIPHETPFQQRAEGMGMKFGGGGARITLGDHAIAGKLRELGLPKRPLMAMWTEKMVMRFGAPRKL